MPDNCREAIQSGLMSGSVGGPLGMLVGAGLGALQHRFGGARRAREFAQSYAHQVPTYSLVESGLAQPRLGVFARRTNAPPSLAASGSGQAPSWTVPTYGGGGAMGPTPTGGGAPAQEPGYTVPNYGGEQPPSNGLGPTPGGGTAPTVPRSTRRASAYRLNVAVKA